jgi:hypothetical protein
VNECIFWGVVLSYFQSGLLRLLLSTCPFGVVALTERSVHSPGEVHCGRRFRSDCWVLLQFKLGRCYRGEVADLIEGMSQGRQI